jgi:hypothetical protein
MQLYKNMSGCLRLLHPGIFDAILDAFHGGVWNPLFLVCGLLLMLSIADL